MNKRNRLIIMTSITILVLLVFGGIAYAYFSAITSGDEGSSIIVQTANMQLLFTDHGELTMEDVLPGDKISKEFEVKNIGNADATYNIRWKEITNEFINSELTLSLQCTAYNSSNVSQGSCGVYNDVVGYSVNGAIKANIEIPVGITHKYTMTITFIETGENQDYNQGKSFNGSLLIDTINLNVTTIRGVLLDENSNTLANKTIEVHSDPMTTTTNSNGEFILEGIEYGNHELIIKDNNTEIARSNIVLEMTNSNTKVTDTKSIYWNETQKNVVKVKVETSTNTITKIDLDWGEIDTRCFAYDSTSTSITDYYCYQGNTKELPTITDVVIPSEINGIALKTIGGSAFYNNQLTSVIIPDSVTSIGSSAFSSNNLTSVAIPDSVTSIKDWTFLNNQLTSVTIGNSVTEIGWYAFGRNQLTSVVIPDNVKTIKYEAFINNNLTSAIIGNSVTIIENKAFMNNKLTSLIIPDSVTKIHYSAFASNQLTSVTIPKSVISIGNFAFKSNKLTSIDYPGGITMGGGVFNQNPIISDEPFFYYKNKDGTYDKSIIIGYINDNTSSVIIPDTVKTIYDYSFQEENLTSVTIGNNVKTIGEGAFDTNKLKSVIIPDSVTSIGPDAFWHNNLTSVTIPDSVTSIGYRAFEYSSLTSVIIPDSITSISWKAFASNRLTSVTIPDSVKYISESAFESNGLTSVTIPNSVITIGNYAFKSNGLTSVTIPDSVTTIGKEAFKSNRLTTVKIGSGVTSIGSDAFYKNGTWSNSNLSLIEIDNVSTAISGSPWGAGDATIKWLRDEEVTE